MRGTLLLVSVLVGGAGSWFKVPVALTATGAPSRTTNRSSVDVVLVPVLMQGLGLQSWTRSFTCLLRPTTGALVLQYRKLQCSLQGVRCPCGAVASSVVDVPVLTQRRGLLSVLEKVVDMPVVFNDRCSEVPQVQCVDKVVDVPVVQVLVAPQVVDVLAVAVHRQGVDVPVIFQGLEIPTWLVCKQFGWMVVDMPC